MTERHGSSIGILIAAHGERGGYSNNQVLMGLRDRVAVAVAPVPVGAGVLSGVPGIDEAVLALADSGCRELLVYPFFMSDGYFVRTVVPRRVAASAVAVPWRMLAPLGLSPRMPALVDQVAVTEAHRAGWQPSQTRLLLVGHGSTSSRASAEATEAIASKVAALGSFAAVEAAFLEEPPYVADRLVHGAAPTIVVGFMSGEGLHGRDDIPALVERAPGKTRYAGPIGAAAGVADLVIEAIGAAMARETP